jgi:hypothetical protein
MKISLFTITLIKFSTYNYTVFASHANTSPTHWCTVLCQHFKIGIQSPIFIPPQSMNDVAHTSVPAIHCIDSIHAPIICVPLSDKATNQTPHKFPSVILVLGATALRIEKAMRPFSHRHHAHTPARGHEDSWGRHEGCKHHCTVAPSSSMLLLLG